jgi:hypothetical protein
MVGFEGDLVICVTSGERSADHLLIVRRLLRVAVVVAFVLGGCDSSPTALLCNEDRVADGSGDGLNGAVDVFLAGRPVGHRDS